jgi:hypothetical protein
VDGSYLGNEVEPVEGDDVGVLDETPGEVVDGDVVVLVGTTFVVVPQPATSPTDRTVATSNTISPDPRIFFTAVPPLPRITRTNTQRRHSTTFRPRITFFEERGISIHIGKHGPEK